MARARQSACKRDRFTELSPLRIRRSGPVHQGQASLTVDETAEETAAEIVGEKGGRPMPSRRPSRRFGRRFLHGLAIATILCGMSSAQVAAFNRRKLALSNMVQSFTEGVILAKCWRIAAKSAGAGATHQPRNGWDAHRLAGLEQGADRRIRGLQRNADA